MKIGDRVIVDQKCAFSLAEKLELSSKSKTGPLTADHIADLSNSTNLFMSMEHLLHSVISEKMN